MLRTTQIFKTPSFCYISSTQTSNITKKNTITFIFYVILVVYSHTSYLQLMLLVIKSTLTILQEKKMTTYEIQIKTGNVKDACRIL